MAHGQDGAEGQAVGAKCVFSPPIVVHFSFEIYVAYGVEVGRVQTMDGHGH